MKKAKDLIPHILSAKTEDDAINVLNKTVEMLHLSQNYYHLKTLKDRLDEYQNDFRALRNKYVDLGEVKFYKDLIEIRFELNFLYQEINDELGFEINKAKIFNEERKTVVRAEAMRSLKSDEEFQKEIKATSASALRDIVGASAVYQEYTTMASMAYGMYSEFHKLMEAIKVTTDSLASECRQAQHIEHKDMK